jgi:hypothetical protein
VSRYCDLIGHEIAKDLLRDTVFAELFIPVLRFGGRAQIDIGSPLTRVLELRRFCPRSVYKPVFGMTARPGNTGFDDWTGIMQPLAPSVQAMSSQTAVAGLVKVQDSPAFDWARMLTLK